jgi:hypothetical protein
MDKLITGCIMPWQEIQRGELGTLDQIRTELRLDLFDEVISRTFNLFTSVWSTTNTPSNFTNAVSTGLTATNLDNAMENVIERSGSVRAIIGTRRSLLPLYGFASYREFLLSDSSTRVAPYMEEVLLERYRTGKIGTYNGALIVEIPQVLEKRLPNMDRKLVRDDVVVVVGENPGSVVLFGETQTQDHIDTTKQPPDYVLHNWQEFAFMIDNPEGIHIIETS